MHVFQILPYSFKKKFATTVTYNYNSFTDEHVKKLLFYIHINYINWLSFPSSNTGHLTVVKFEPKILITKLAFITLFTNVPVRPTLQNSNISTKVIVKFWIFLNTRQSEMRITMTVICHALRHHQTCLSTVSDLSFYPSVLLLCFSNAILLGPLRWDHRTIWDMCF